MIWTELIPVIVAGVVVMPIGTTGPAIVIGNWIIVDTSTNGEVKGAVAYPTAGTIIGVALTSGATGGTGSVGVMVGLK